MARFDRRSFLAGSAALGAGLALLGADDEWAGASLTNGTGRNGISTAKPKRGGSVTFGIDTEEGGFDPTTARWDEGGFLYGRCVFDPLAIVTSTGEVQGYLAESIVPNADYTAWTITLRSGINFHDGTPLNATALHTNIEKQATSILTGPAFASMIKDAVITGPMSVRIDMKSPWVPFPYYLAQAQTGYIAAPSMLAAADGTSNPVGTGPFIFKEWVPNDHFTATANPKYWRKGFPYLDSITFKPIIDPNARVSALKSGTIDMMHTNVPTSLLEFRGDHSYSYYDNSGPVLGEPTVACVMLNTSKPPFNNLKLRQALALASNPVQYAKEIDGGVNAPMYGLFQQGTPYYSKTAYKTNNAKQASKLIKEVEAETGQSVSFTFNSTSSSQVLRGAQYLQQLWGDVGAKMTIAIAAQASLINDALAGTYEATAWRQFGAVDPDLNYVWFSTTTTSPPLALNMARNSDPRIQAALTAGRTTANKAERTKAYQQLNQYLNEDVPYIWADRDTWAVIADPKVQNFANPKTLNGTKAIAFDEGVLWPTQIWVS
ncbi:MAG TPA: ABC transporter substrate-binding protein [Acidimicrobiales bacterium]|jgi:ABC-type transport system substrate-binding protein